MDIDTIKEGEIDVATLSQGQALVRILQSRFTNKEIATLLDYNSPSSISAISRGVSGMSKERLADAYKAVSYLDNNGYGLWKNPPSLKQLTNIRKTIRKNRKNNPLDAIRLKEQIENEFPRPPQRPPGPTYAWRTASVDEIGTYIDVQTRLRNNNLVYAYYNMIHEIYLVSSVHLDYRKINKYDVTGFMAQIHMEGVDKNMQPFNKDWTGYFPLYTVGATPNEFGSIAEMYQHIVNESSELQDDDADMYRFMYYDTSVQVIALVNRA